MFTLTKRRFLYFWPVLQIWYICLGWGSSLSARTGQYSRNASCRRYLPFGWASLNTFVSIVTRLVGVGDIRRTKRHTTSFNKNQHWYPKEDFSKRRVLYNKMVYIYLHRTSNVTQCLCVQIFCLFKRMYLLIWSFICKCLNMWMWADDVLIPLEKLTYFRFLTY